MKYHLIMQISFSKSNSRNPGYTNHEPQGRYIPNRTYPSFLIPSHKLNNPQKSTFKMPSSKTKMISLVSYESNHDPLISQTFRIIPSVQLSNRLFEPQDPIPKTNSRKQRCTNKMPNVQTDNDKTIWQTLKEPEKTRQKNPKKPNKTKTKQNKKQK